MVFAKIYALTIVVSTERVDQAKATLIRRTRALEHVRSRLFCDIL